MEKKRPIIRRNIAVIVGLLAGMFLISGIALGLWSARDMKRQIVEQFNNEQLVIARNTSGMIERELNTIKDELLLLSKDKSFYYPSHFAPDEMIQKSFSRVLEKGVWRIFIIDRGTQRALLYMPYKNWPGENVSDIKLSDLTIPEKLSREKVWLSEPRLNPSGISMMLAVPLSPPVEKILLFDVNISWFLTPFLKNIRSGKTGYAWIVDRTGIFLYHPYSDFIGKDAFTVRRERDPETSYRKINFIQKERMLKGEAGMSWYYSDWHRGFTGQQKKLIAYYPISISEDPPQKWSVAVTAPLTEVEAIIRNGYSRQILLQGMIILVILSAVSAVFYFEVRWSRAMEERVDQRTNELKRSEERYRSLVESAEDFIFTLDGTGAFQSMNSFTAHFFAGSPEDFIGKDLEHVFPAEISARLYKIIESVYQKEKSIRDEFELKLDDHQVWLNANFMPLKNQTGEVSSVLCIARDITENKKLEKQLINTEKLASLGTLAAGVAHEINNPMSIILGFCDFLIQKANKGTQAYEDLKTIERQGLHCKEIVENLLSFARFGEGNCRHSDLHQCLAEILKVVRHSLEMRGISLVTEFTEGMPMVKGDPRQLQQVFLNLISNAMAAMGQGCTLTIRTKQERIARKAVIQFQDDGVGIREEDMDHIFEPFFTTKPEGEGTGLGLFVSYGIISKYGGTIDCLSQSNGKSGGLGGTVFTVKLPLEGRDG